MANQQTRSEKAVKDHLRHLRLEGLSDLTVYHRERNLIRLAAAIPAPVLDATPDMLYDWRAGLKVAGPTVAGYVSHIREFYNWAVDKELIAANPAARIPVPPQPRRIPRPIAEKDLMAALGLASRRIRLMLVLAAWCGLRACEIAGLRAENIRLHDADPVLIVIGKGGGERAVPLCDFAVAELAAAGLPACGLVFTGATGRALRPWMISKLCNTHLHDCGVANTLHSLRARCATAGYAADHNILAVRDLLGHASVQTTEIYALASQASVRAVVRALPVPRTEPHRKAG